MYVLNQPSSTVDVGTPSNEILENLIKPRQVLARKWIQLRMGSCVCVVNQIASSAEMPVKRSVDHKPSDQHSYVDCGTQDVLPHSPSLPHT